MGIVKDIWNTLFGKPKQQEKFQRSGSIAEPVMQVVHNKNDDEIDVERSSAEIELTEPNPQFCNNVQQGENIRPNDLSAVPKPKKKKSKNIIGQKTLSEIKDYLLTYGSIDVLTCEQKFKAKSLHNFIWQLRKDGLKIKTEKVFLNNEFSQKVEVTNYRLISLK